MKTYTIQVSNTSGANQLPVSREVADSWKTVYDGPIATPREARKAVKDLAIWYRNVRCFVNSKDIGKLFQEIYQ